MHPLPFGNPGAALWWIPRLIVSEKGDLNTCHQRLQVDHIKMDGRIDAMCGLAIIISPYTPIYMYMHVGLYMLFAC